MIVRTSYYSTLTGSGRIRVAWSEDGRRKTRSAPVSYRSVDPHSAAVTEVFGLKSHEVEMTGDYRMHKGYDFRIPEGSQPVS